MRKFDTILAAADESAIIRAAGLIRDGQVVAIPTETVYGLAANALSPLAVAKIFEVKGRPADNPLIVHISHLGELAQLTENPPDIVYKLAEKFWPGPLTMVLPSSKVIPKLVRAGLDTVGIRLPGHPIARRLIEHAGLPLAAPSANISGRPSPTAASHCLDDLDGLIPMVLDGGTCRVGVESTVLSLVGDTPRILRPGLVTPEQIELVAGRVEIDPAVYRKPTPNTPAASPGMLHTHYSPKAEVVILSGDWQNCRRYMAAQPDGCFGLVFEEELDDCPLPALSLGRVDDNLAHAHNLFSLLRELDQDGATKVFARAPKDEGVGLAVYNRLIRAAAFNEIKL